MCIGRLLPEPINLFSSIQESENSKDSYSLHSHAYPILCLICELLVSLKSMNKRFEYWYGFFFWSISDTFLRLLYWRALKIIPFNAYHYVSLTHKLKENILSLISKMLEGRDPISNPFSALLTVGFELQFLTSGKSVRSWARASPSMLCWWCLLQHQ